MLSKKIIYPFLVLAMLALAGAARALAPAPDKSFDLKLNYDRGDLKLSEITLVNLPAADRRVQPNDGWKCEIISATGAAVDSFNFVVPSIVCRDQPGQAGLEGGCLAQEAADFGLSVPYYSDGAIINIYNPNGDIAFSASTMAFADLCGDDICQSNENRLTCAKDCRSGVRDGACDGVKDGTCDPDCASGKDPDCAAPGNNYLMIFVLIIAFGLAGAAVWQGRKGK